MGSLIEDKVGRLSLAGGKALLAISGGIDSMCLATAYKAAGVDFAVAHCNFHLRGKDSDADEALVRDWCRQKGVECFVKDFDTASYAASQGISIEMAAREQRYCWFAELCRDKGFAALVVAHNANDNAETLLLNLLRGTGLKGLCGIQPEAQGVWGGTEIKILRPLLDVTRAEIQAYVAEKGVPYRDDATNADTVYKRNKIRHKILPVLEELNPSFLDTLSSDMANFREANAVLDDWFEFTSMEVTSYSADAEMDIRIDALLAAHNWKYFLFRLLNPYGFNRVVVGEICEMLSKTSSPEPGKMFESAEYCLVTTAGLLKLFKKVEPFSIDVAGEGEYQCGDSMVKVTVEAAPESAVQPLGTVILDAESLNFPLKLRSWRDGDWMKPLGMRGCRKKLSDLFVDLKMSVPEKERAVLLEYPGEEGRIASIVGLRIDESLKVKASSSKVIRLTIVK